MKKVAKNLGLFLAALLVVFGAFKLGMKYELESTKQAVEDEIRLVQEHTAEAVKSMFLNIPEVRDALQEGKIYRTEMYWWNFDREYSMTVSYGKNRIYTDWCDLQR